MATGDEVQQDVLFYIEGPGGASASRRSKRQLFAIGALLM
jgi:hypothetical protein